jgi:alpha-galactosidase
MWAILAAPMMVSADIAGLPTSTVAMLTNREAIAVSQDRLGRQGRRLARRGPIEVWVKPLAGGSRAVAVLNRGARPASILLAPQMLGWPRGRLVARWVWQHRTSGGRVVRVRLAGTSAELLRVSR